MISVVYAVYNEEENLARSLESVYAWADEIIVVDGASTDKTASIAKKFGTRLVTTTNKSNFHINKQMAIDEARGELILQLDADEVVDQSLKQFIIQTAQKKDHSISAWYLKRKNLFFKTWLRKGGQYPDMVIRLFWRGQAYLPQKDVHEQMVVRGKTAIATGHLWHYANPDLASYWRKFNTYTSFKAQQLQEKQTPLNFRTFLDFMVLKPLVTFLSLFVRHRGYIDGTAGFLFALFSSYHHPIAYLKYIEQRKKMTLPQMKVFYPISDLAYLHQNRGVGKYQKWLTMAIDQLQAVIRCKKAQQAEIIHYSFFDLFRSTLKKVKRQQKLIVTVHDVIPLLFPHDYPYGWRAKFNLYRQKKRLQKADLIMTDSQASKNDLEKVLRLPAEKIKVVYLAPNPQLASASVSVIKKMRTDYHLPLNYLLYVGDINFNKNLRQLIKALKFLSEKIALVLVGKNFRPQNIREWQALEEQINLSAVRDRVYFLTQIDDDQSLSALYSGALAYVQPSYYEGFGLPILEAMRCKTVVVAHRNSSIPEVGGEHIFYSESLQAEAWAEQIEKILNLSASERQKHLERAFSWQENFSWTKTANEVLALYEQVAS